VARRRGHCGCRGRPGVEAAIARGAILGEATNQARELANDPAIA
jgi:hypothetical protein